MRTLARILRDLWLDWRTLRWLWRLRFELWRNGGRLRVESWRGVRMAESPRIRCVPLGEGDGTMTLRLSRDVVFGYGTILEVWAHGTNVLELTTDVRCFEGSRIELRGGSIEVGAHTVVHDNAVLKSDGVLKIGAHSRVSYGSCLHCSESIDCADWTGLAEYVTITDSDHTPDGTDVPNNRRPIITSPVVIERNVFFGRGAVVLRGAHIGTNSAVAANAIVRRGTYPPGMLLAGSPAKPIKPLAEIEKARLERGERSRPATHGAEA